MTLRPPVLALFGLVLVACAGQPAPAPTLAPSADLGLMLLASDVELWSATDAACAAGSPCAVPVAVVRLGSLDEPVEILADDLPVGVSAHPLTIPADRTQGVLTLRSTASTPPGATSAAVRATAGSLVRTAGVGVRVRFRAGVFTPELGLVRGNAAGLGFEFRSAAPVTVSVEGLPGGISSSLVTVAPPGTPGDGTPDGILTIAAQPEAPLGRAVGAVTFESNGATEAVPLDLWVRAPEYAFAPAVVDGRITLAQLPEPEASGGSVSLAVSFLNLQPNTQYVVRRGTAESALAAASCAPTLTEQLMMFATDSSGTVTLAATELGSRTSLVFVHSASDPSQAKVACANLHG